MEVRSAKKDLQEEHLIRESGISKDIPERNDEETHILNNEGNAEGNLRETVYDGIPSNTEDDCNEHEDTHGKEVPDILIKSSCSDDRNNLDKAVEGNNVEDNNDSTTEKVLERLSHLVDSDSEGEVNLGETSNKESPAADHRYDTDSIEGLQRAEYKKDAKNKGTRRIIDSESEEDIQRSVTDHLFETVNRSAHTTTSNYRALIDPESEEEEERIVHKSSVALDNTDISGTRSAKEKSVKRRKGSIRASKEDAMRQIHSETQRLLREAEVSLPYHRPKQRTLQEFLSRKKLSTALPKASSIAAKLKMSSVIVSRALAEKEKEAELFYKSSDSEDDIQSTPAFKNEMSALETRSEKMPSVDIKHTCIQDIQKIGTDNPDLHNKSRTTQDHVDLGILEVLSAKDRLETGCRGKELPTLPGNNSNQGGGSDILAQQLTKECKQKLHRDSVSRKLFDADFENEANEVSDVSYHQQEAMNERVDTIIASLIGEKSIDDRKEAENSVPESHISEISKTRQRDAEMIDESGGGNFSTEIMKRSDRCINNKEMDETLHKNNATSNIDVTSTKSDDYIIMQDGNRERRNKCAEMDDVSLPSTSGINVQSKVQDIFLIEEDEKYDGHVLGLPLPKFTQTLPDRKRSLLRSVPSAKVTLKGSPGMIIDLTDNVRSNGKGVNTLLDRFFYKHIVNSNKQADSKSEVTVVRLQDTPNGPTPVKEILPYKLPNNIDNHELNKPGAKLMRLKEDLKLQMTLKRNKEWKQKEIELQEEKEQDEENDYNDFDGHDKAENCESSDSGESEPEENDVCIKDRKRSKCLFADDEAEVTDDESLGGSAEEEICSENDTDESDKQSASIKNGNKKGHMDNNLSEIESEEEEVEADEDLYINIEDGKESGFKDGDCKIVNVTRNKKEKKAKQLIQEFQDDPNITNQNNLENASNQSKNITDVVDKFRTHREDNSISEDESDMSVFQHRAETATRSQVCKTPVTKTSLLDFVSPITQLSVLNTTLDSNKKDKSERREYLGDKYEFISIESTQIDKSPEYPRNIKNKTISQKKLFDDAGETIDDEYLMQLCSGTFGSMQKTDLDLKDIFSQSNTSKSQSRESFNATNNKLSDMKQLENSEVENESSQDIKLTFDEDLPHSSVDHLKELRKDNAMNSGLKLRIVSSDDEDQSDEENTFLKSKKRPVRRLDLSDSEEEDAQSLDEEKDDVSDKEEYIDYDSEENEVIVVPKKDMKKAAADFVEEEAELSESDWDSADEDEKGLSELELEEGDNEHIDEDEVKDQLGKIHRKQMLDEDKREVKLLQELLFEDGDLHTDGTGRERKFRWRNIDKLENNIETAHVLDENDGLVDAQEEEEEAQWSKLRHERDKFLEERMKNSSNGIEDELYNSQIFKLGLEALKKIKTNDSQKQNASLGNIDLSENIDPITPRNITDLLNTPNTGKKSQTIYNVIKRRSLLTRGEESLARIASLAKQSDSVSHMVKTRNFVFQYIDPDIDGTSKKNETKKEEWDSQDIQNKPQKRKMTSNFSSTTKKKRK